MNSNEQYIENLILQGYHPADVLASVIKAYSPNFVWDERTREKYINEPAPWNFQIFRGTKRNPILTLQELNISPEFINKWFTYPSGLTRTTMKFAGQLPLINLTNQPVLEPELLSVIKSISQIFLDQPILIPVVRYAYSTGLGYLFGVKGEGNYCGTY